MYPFKRFSILAISAFLLSASPLPAQNAKFVVAPSGAGHAEQSKTSNDSQSVFAPQGERPEGIATNTTTNKLKAKIMTALERSYAASAFKITVTTPGRIVIDGEVPSYWDKQNVFAIVARVPGVKEITNRLSVKTAAVPDPVITVELFEYFKRVGAIKKPDTIHVWVTAAQARLSGTVNSFHLKALIEEIVGWHRGVQDVLSVITASPNKAVPDATLLRLIQNMLNCDFPFEEKTVQVKVEPGRVLLSGAVSRLWAKLEIEKAVQNTAGVRQVESRIEITSE